MGFFDGTKKMAHLKQNAMTASLGQAGKPRDGVASTLVELIEYAVAGWFSGLPRMEIAMPNIFRPSSWLRTKSNDDAPAPRNSDRSEREESASEYGAETTISSRVSEPAPIPTAPLKERIEIRAYQKWCDDGCPVGKDVEYWLAAERELLDETNG